MACSVNRCRCSSRVEGYPKVTSTFFRLHISETPEHPPGGWGGAGPFGVGGRSSHPAPELTGEVCLSTAARSELRGLGRSRLCRLSTRLLMTRRGHVRRDGLPLACRLSGPTLRAERPPRHGRAGSRQRRGASRALGRKQVQCRGKRKHPCTMGRSDPRHHQTMTRS